MLKTNHFNFDLLQFYIFKYLQDIELFHLKNVNRVFNLALSKYLKTSDWENINSFLHENKKTYIDIIIKNQREFDQQQLNSWQKEIDYLAYSLSKYQNISQYYDLYEILEKIILNKIKENTSELQNLFHKYFCINIFDQIFEHCYILNQNQMNEQFNIAQAFNQNNGDKFNQIQDYDIVVTWDQYNHSEKFQKQTQISSQQTYFILLKNTKKYSKYWIISAISTEILYNLMEFCLNLINLYENFFTLIDFDPDLDKIMLKDQFKELDDVLILGEQELKLIWLQGMNQKLNLHCIQSFDQDLVWSKNIY